MELTHYSEGRHNLRDILLGLNSKDRRQEEGGGGLHFCSALGNMAAPESQTIQWGSNVIG